MTTRKEIDSMIRKFDPAVKRNTKEFQAYRVLLTAAVVGGKERKIMAFWDGFNSDMRDLIREAKRQGIFLSTGKLDAEIYEDGIGMAMGAACLMGFIRRVRQ